VEEIFWDDRLDASGITVEVDDGVVTLRGEAPTYFAKRVATTIAWNVGGATAVNNLLEVNYAGATPTDAELTANVENSLTWNSYLDPSRIIVSVQAGVVILEGDVDSHWKCKEAEDLVSGLSGVVAVENKLAVVPTGDFADEAIAADIVAAIDRHALLDNDRITVKVADGAVTLSGTVPSYLASAEAAHIAYRTTGVLKVTNDLRNVT
jgi:osmotically-inducible protein OsmY